MHPCRLVDPPGSGHPSQAASATTMSQLPDSTTYNESKVECWVCPYALPSGGPATAINGARPRARKRESGWAVCCCGTLCAVVCVPAPLPGSSGSAPCGGGGHAACNGCDGLPCRPAPHIKLQEEACCDFFAWRGTHRPSLAEGSRRSLGRSLRQTAPPASERRPLPAVKGRVDWHVLLVSEYDSHRPRVAPRAAPAIR